ncbi:hypothetical protein HYY72_03315 [Candidatus Woesearchaeota archaeon]|nr:hypothetical protein [Candidatus Woesearchaeota archaeon]
MKPRTAALIAFSIIFAAGASLILMNKPKNNATGYEAINMPIEQAFDYKILFCSESGCLSEIKRLIQGSIKADCAMYNFNPYLMNGSENKALRIVTDSNYKSSSPLIRNDNRSSLMHNKFCIFDSRTVLTGSFNPGSSPSDRNNMIIINSPSLARIYEAEFEELWSGKFGGGKSTTNRIMLNNTLVEIYFCPEDHCALQVERQLEKASSSIYFMAYSFTHRGIANELVLNYRKGVEIKGVFDSSTGTDAYSLLNAQGINARIDKKKGIMHHKVFIIDNSTVITGSFNPTNNADTKNDENVLIIHNREVALEYLKEFERVWE